VGSEVSRTVQEMIGSKEFVPIAAAGTVVKILLHPMPAPLGMGG
jgi:hypothetical protein